MRDYRLYWFTNADHISHARSDEFESDEDAVSAAQRRIGLYAAVEVWQRKRFVVRVVNADDLPDWQAAVRTPAGADLMADSA